MGSVFKDKQHFAPIAQAKDYSSSYFDINKGVDQQLTDTNKDKWGRAWTGSGASKMAGMNKAAAQSRFNVLQKQGQTLMSGAGPARAEAPAEGGMNFTAPDKAMEKVKKQGSLLTGANQQSLYSR